MQELSRNRPVPVSPRDLLGTLNSMRAPSPPTPFTATVYLEAKPTYTLDGLSEDFFQVPGATEVSYSYDNRGLSPPSSPRPAAIPFTIRQCCHP